MNLVKKILGKLFAVWAALVFVSSLLVVIIPVLMISNQPEPKRTRSLYRIFQVWMAFFFFFAGVRRIFKGRENFKKGENYIVLCNHNSFMDIPLSSPGIPGPNKTIAKTEIAKVPVFGTIYKTGSVLVDRKSEQSRKASYLKMKEVLQLGLHMCIYPEGTRNTGKEPLQRFHDGAFRLAVDTQKKIIPTVILYTAKVLPRKGFSFWPHRVEMHFLPPVDPAGKTSEELKQEVFQIMKDHYVREMKGKV